MRPTLNLIAVDLGAESGRVMSAAIDDHGIRLGEVHRFHNGPVRIFDHLHWDILRLFSEIKYGLGLCAKKSSNWDGIGIDTWGVDFGLLDKSDQLLGNPFHYRDSRTDGMPEQVYKLVSKERIFSSTGIQFMQLNSLYQLFSMRNSEILGLTRTFLTIPDLLNFWLSGVKVCEFTNATTTQLYNQITSDWSYDLLRDLKLPSDIFLPVVYPGTIIGKLLDHIGEETCLRDVPVIVPACHDTGSAVAAVPVINPRFAYISSGTWSLIGVEISEPIITPESLRWNFTNEGGVANRVRFLKNVTGLWLLQECRRKWMAQGKNYTYSDLTRLVSGAEPFLRFIDPDAIDFLHPDDMPSTIQQYCIRTGQLPPQDVRGFVRCIFESLALKYRFTIERLESLIGYSLEVIHIIGGGSQNELLNQITADACGKMVVAGPVEATALGNAMVQAVSLGFFTDISDARGFVSGSVTLKTYTPNYQMDWDTAYARFLTLLE
jgi:rhamnulokinase